MIEFNKKKTVFLTCIKKIKRLNSFSFLVLHFRISLNKKFDLEKVRKLFLA